MFLIPPTTTRVCRRKRPARISSSPHPLRNFAFLGTDRVPVDRRCFQTRVPHPFLRHVQGNLRGGCLDPESVSDSFRACIEPANGGGGHDFLDSPPRRCSRPTPKSCAR